MLPITATIITLNEEENIEACIASARKICDEVIVVDSLSTDATVEIAERNGAKVYKQAYLGDGPQKAFGTQYAKNDWIFSIDADERLDDELVAAITALELKDPNTAYAVNRKNHIGTRWVKAGGFYPDYVTRLYNKQVAGYSDRKGHARVVVDQVERVETGHLLHYTYRDISHWVERINALSSRDAWSMHCDGKQPSKSAPITHAIAAGIRTYLLKGGIFQGADGFAIALANVYGVYLKYAKLNEMYDKEGRGGV